MLLDKIENRSTLNFLRALGILLVICFHAVAGLTRLLEGDALYQYMADVPQFLNIAWQALGSELIFLFSGFLLSYSVLRELTTNGSIDIRAYYVRRVARLIPLYLLGLALYSLAGGFTGFELFLNVLFISKLFNAETIIPVGWSLEVLVQFYILLPFLVLLLVRSRHAMLLTVVLIILSLAIRFAVLYSDPSSYQTPIYTFFQGGSPSQTQSDLYYHLIYRATPFLMGFLMAYAVVHREPELEKYLGRRAVLYGVLLLSVAVILLGGFLPIHDQHSFLYTRFDKQFWLWFWTFQRFLFALGLCGLVLASAYGRSRALAPLAWLAGRPLWAVVSNNIYTVFLFHPVFLIPSAVIAFRATSAEVIGRVHTMEILLLIVLTAVLSTLTGKLVYRYVERPSRDWIRRVLL